MEKPLFLVPPGLKLSILREEDKDKRVLGSCSNQTNQGNNVAPDNLTWICSYSGDVPCLSSGESVSQFPTLLKSKGAMPKHLFICSDTTNKRIHFSFFRVHQGVGRDELCQSMHIFWVLPL